MGYLKLGRLVFKPSERARLLVLLLFFQVNVVFCPFFSVFRAASLYSPRQLFQKSTMTLRWQKGEVSNFQYLMFLNTIAGKHIGDQLSYLCFEFISFRPFWWVAGITPLLGKKCWRSGESSRLSVLWFWFDSLVRLVYFLSRFRSKDFPRGSLIFRLT